jgi:hypothetical protein
MGAIGGGAIRDTFEGVDFVGSGPANVACCGRDNWAGGVIGGAEPVDIEQESCRGKRAAAKEGTPVDHFSSSTKKQASKPHDTASFVFIRCSLGEGLDTAPTRPAPRKRPKKARSMSGSIPLLERRQASHARLMEAISSSIGAAGQIILTKKFEEYIR